MSSRKGQVATKKHTKTQADDTKNALDTGDSLTTQKLAIVKTNVTRWTLYNKGRG